MDAITFFAVAAVVVVGSLVVTAGGLALVLWAAWKLILRSLKMAGPWRPHRTPPLQSMKLIGSTATL